MQATASLATLQFWNDRLIWTSMAHVGGESSRPYIAILVSGSNTLKLVHDGQTYEGSAIAVGANILRSINAQDGFYSLNLDPIHPICRSLRKKYFDNNAVWNLSNNLSPSIQKNIRSQIEQSTDCRTSRENSDELLSHLFPELEIISPIDERIMMAACWLRENLPTKSYMEELCNICDLSSGRLTHLFTLEMGAPIKSYLLAMKMRRAAELFGQGVTLTEIAHEMGFSDSAHLTRAFQAHYSVPPSFLANPDLVHVQVCDQLCNSR